VNRRWRFVDEFPMTATGKIQKFALLDRLDDDGPGH
jgi:acyl-coenzyme A synthetase/AMP-(fatty) acid ligase